MSRSFILLSALFIVVILAGCDNGPGPATPTGAPAVPTNTGSALSAATSTLNLPATVEVSSATATSATPEATPAPTGGTGGVSNSGLVALFKSAGLPMDDATIYTADTDPDKLLGTPNQYIAKAGWHDKRLPDPANPEQIALSDGGEIEIFAELDGGQEPPRFPPKPGERFFSSGIRLCERPPAVAP